jgi:hypothetical protein
VGLLQVGLLQFLDSRGEEFALVEDGWSSRTMVVTSPPRGGGDGLGGAGEVAWTRAQAARSSSAGWSRMCFWAAPRQSIDGVLRHADAPMVLDRLQLSGVDVLAQALP